MKMNSTWPKVPLREVLTYLDERVTIDDWTEYITISVRRRHGGLEERSRLLGSQIRTKKQFRLVPGSFIISRIQCWHQAYCLVPDQVPHNMIASTNYDQFALSPNLDSRFFWWVCHSDYFNKTIRDSASGVVIEKMVFDRDAWLDQSIPLPTFEEQRQMAFQIDQIAVKTEKAQQLRRQVISQIDNVEGDVVAQVFKRGESLGWPRAKLGDYVVEARYGTSEKADDDKSGTPIIRMGNISKGRLDLHELKYLHLSGRDRERILVHKGDILVNRTNSAELVGKCAVFEIDGDYGFASYIIRLRLDTNRADPWLVAYYINSPEGRAYMFDERKQMTGQANVNATKLKAMPISLPPRAQQSEIVNYFRSIENRVEVLKRLQLDTANALDIMLPSILNEISGGELSF